MKNVELEEAFGSDISGYGPQLYDSYCGEPIGWGYKILRHLGDEKFKEIGQYGKLDCAYPSWFVITHYLNREEAIEKYGNVTGEERGPRGGFQNITFGDKKFCRKELAS